MGSKKDLRVLGQNCGFLVKSVRLGRKLWVMHKICWAWDKVVGSEKNPCGWNKVVDSKKNPCGLEQNCGFRIKSVGLGTKLWVSN